MEAGDILSSHHFDKLFSLDEASELLPKLELLIRELQSSAQALRARMRELHATDTAIERMTLSEVIESYPELKQSATRMAEIAREIESHGCFLKDIDLGLIDFPWALDDEQIVFLCWQSGETALEAWHPVEGGFAQRQPIPGVNKQYLN
jgi:hypothetical protein